MEKIVLITGSSKGIGKATAIEFAKLGGKKVVINYLTDKENAEKLSSYLKEEYKTETLVIKADVSDEEQVKNMVQETINKFGRIDILVNNAGIAIDKGFEDRTVEDWKRTLEVNTIGTFLVSKYDIRTNNINKEDLIEKRNEIKYEYLSICKNSLDAKSSAIRKASKALKVRQDNTYSDEEIDSYLPVDLRKNK